MPQSRQLTVRQAISLAEKETNLGNTATAIQLYRAVLQHQPDHPDAKAALQRLANMADPPRDQMEPLIKLYQSGRLPRAAETCQNLLKTYPQSLAVLNILGAVRQAQGKISEALEVFDRTLTLNPHYAEGYNNRGVALKRLGRIAEAADSYEKAVGLNPEYVAAHNNLGHALNLLGRHPDAVRAFEAVIKLKPDHVQARYNSANTLIGLGRLAEALLHFDKILELVPDYAEAYNNRGIVRQALGQQDAAASDFKEAVRLTPDSAEAHNNLGIILQDQEDLVGAANAFLTAIRLKPDYPDAHNNHGNLMKILGKQSEAIRGFEKAISLKPDYAEAHRNLSTLKTFVPGDPHIRQLAELIQVPDLGDTDRHHLHFALGKAYKDVEAYDRAFTHLKEGNRLRKKELQYSIASDKKLFHHIKSTFAAPAVPVPVTDAPSPALRPIFILGMPRSGTTLVEQILASHSQVFGAGELKLLGRSIRQANQQLDDLSARRLADIRKTYLAGLADLSSPQPLVTDKMPLNFRWIGYILMAFPDVGIVHVKRDPIATCWSIFTHFFSEKGNGYAYDLSDVAAYYNLYADLMNFWHEKFPDKIYDLSYETLTENQEPETRKLLAYTGLEWEDGCLAFHKTRRAVKTASSEQVRKKIYQGSSAAWKHFEAHLAPLVSALGDFTDQ